VESDPRIGCQSILAGTPEEDEEKGLAGWVINRAPGRHHDQWFDFREQVEVFAAR
jgi:hypothetical protein